eukprot:5747489-Pyramimonas_sp.AAC.1
MNKRITHRGASRKTRGKSWRRLMPNKEYPRPPILLRLHAQCPTVLLLMLLMILIPLFPSCLLLPPHPPALPRPPTPPPTSDFYQGIGASAAAPGFYPRIVGPRG